MVEVFVSVGSNIAREKNIRSGVRTLREHFTDLQCSSVYESAAEGFDGDPFYNLVVWFQGQNLSQINHCLREIEHQHGRVRQAQKFCSRTLDLDLLLFGDQNLHSEGWDIPREEIKRYAFILRPLAEIAPDRCYPGSSQTMLQLWTLFQQNHPKILQQIQPIAFEFGFV
ncbi:MAG: 2-amino-4-hydroxy-6-hydroxymethyldihydropteridine diphosphokinase [Gammaproteobacteria bacterium]|nr:2-amino-4-hydroxy-6-hydroxymethyldihydropteridine diphosphokinase [Gammaproteobacteria bacterium]MDH5801152.1 2-amino-4-hydroxy-6-hydroxymethyldihydropteridine diphosphokinase [Gammaproteobacteria bacterium]